MATKRRRTLACDVCRERKVKCNGDIPCTNCLDRGEKCFVTDKKQRRRLYAAEEDSIDARLSRIEALLNRNSQPRSDTGRSSHEIVHRKEAPVPTSTSPSKSQQEAEPSTYSTSRLASLHLAPEHVHTLSEDGSVYSAETSNLEYVGPRTFLSVCSVPAISWISDRLGSDAFQLVAASLLRDITRRLRPSQSLPLARKPEPSPEDAWRYAEAYFDEAPEAAFGVVSKSRFEDALRKHLQGSHSMEDDPGWYALRNMIFASGSRILLSRTTTFQEANRESQGWFFNALAVHTDLLYFRTSIVGLLALILMSYYTEGSGGPSLQHMLVACTVRLAFAKGLHRQPCPSWKLHPDEAAHRSWTFWAVYCLEKHVSVRSERPSAVDDEEVNCPVPSNSPTDSSADAWYCSMMVSMAKLLSRIGKELSSATAMAQNPETALDRVRALDEELQAFADSGKEVLDLKQSSSLPRMVGLTPEQASRIRLMYFEVVFALHSTISRPWLRFVCPKQAENAPYQDQVLYSTEIAASASRSAILSCSQMHLSAQCPHWTALTVPLTACINLFLYILQDSGRRSTQSDLSLLDVGAGHFARLDFATQGVISHSFAREIAQMARTMVMQAAEPSNKRSHEPSQPLQESDSYQQLHSVPDDFDLDTWFNMEMWLPIEY